MKGNSLVWPMLLAFIITSCGKELTRSQAAPRTKDQVGIIASCTSESEAKAISEELGIRYRVLNEKRKIIEFIGVTQTTLEAHLPHSKFRKNKLISDVLISGDFKAKFVNNTEFYGAHTPKYPDGSSSRYFPHLDQINGLNSGLLGEGVVIAIVDTGVYYNHPHLSPNILTNESDPHGNNGDWRDGDGNGYADDYVGWDFYNGDAYPIDDNGHGTHVAGLAASTYMGVAAKAKILPVKVLGSNGQGDLATIAAGVMYAIDRGADVINLSLGGPGGSEITAELQSLINIVKMAKQSNTILVAAAGNGGNDGIGDCNDNSPVYPANIQEDNLISVAAVDLYNQLTDYSNFGGATVHVAAPGGDTYTGGLSSTGISYCYGPCESDETTYFSTMGTSMATPVVAGLVAAVMSKRPDLNYKQVIETIMSNGTRKEELVGLIQSAQVVNVKQTLDAI